MPEQTAKPTAGPTPAVQPTIKPTAAAPTGGEGVCGFMNVPVTMDECPANPDIPKNCKQAACNELALTGEETRCRRGRVGRLRRREAGRRRRRQEPCQRHRDSLCVASLRGKRQRLMQVLLAASRRARASFERSARGVAFGPPKRQ